MNYTEEYYKKHSPRYSLSRMKIIVGWLKEIARPTWSLLDIGCGDGSALAYISEKTGIKNVEGLDSSDNYLNNAKNKFPGITFFEGDICKLDIRKKYDVVIISAVLHHLVGKTRKSSNILANQAVHNCFNLLKTNGTLIIMEPVFSNAMLMTILFYVKKFFAGLSNNRVAVFGYWNNIGAPVVSYFSQGSLKKLTQECGGVIVSEKYVAASHNNLYRLLRLKRGDLYLLIKNSKL